MASRKPHLADNHCNYTLELELNILKVSSTMIQKYDANILPILIAMQFVRQKIFWYLMFLLKRRGSY